jgi:hypothetical protein
MSPEQARGEQTDARTDLFSFGAVLYEMATGKQAFSGSTTAVVFDAVLNRRPPSIVDLNPKLPSGLERVIGRALEKDRMQRYAAAGELRSDLQQVKHEFEIAGVSAREAQRQRVIRRRLAVCAVAVALTIGFAATGRIPRGGPNIAKGVTIMSRKNQVVLHLGEMCETGE